jgi:hypothetical protein
MFSATSMLRCLADLGASHCRRVLIGLGFAWAFLLAAALPSEGQSWTATWTQKADAPPGPRAWVEIAFDSVQGRAILFGGTASQPLNDVWQYDPAGDSWLQLEPTQGCPEGFAPPTARAEHALDFDPINQLLWIFGGAGVACDGPQRIAGKGTSRTVIVDHSLPAITTDFYKDWTVTIGDASAYVSAYDPTTQKLTLASPLAGAKASSLYFLYPQRGGGTFSYSPITRSWSSLTGPHWSYSGPEPADRSGPAMAYSTRDDAIVMFGGQGRNDTWTLNTHTRSWTEMIPQQAAGSPPGLAHLANAMAYDSDDDVFVLFGGCLCTGDGGPSSADTWVYRLSSNSWTKMTPAVSPPPRQGHSLVYDSTNKAVVLFGGFDGESDAPGGTYYNDLWVYRFATNTWTQVFPSSSPPARAVGAMVYDSIH